jgi:D-arabinose 1-dehydrogenase-like Zn-dependent alcohol dehydrogenase
MAVVGYDRPLEAVEVPEPDVPPGYALLEVRTCGVCFSDVKTSRGHMPFSDRLALPHVPGHEIFGVVLETNPPDLLPDGTPVVAYHYWPCGRCAACRRGDEPLCSRMVAWTGFTHPGGFTERIAVPVDRLVRVPDGIDPVHAAPLTCALGTAYRAVVTRGGVRAGERAAIVGLGGVGIHAAQVARAAGAITTGFDVHGPTLDAAATLGLDARRADDEDAVAALLDATDGEGVDVVVDAAGREATLALARRLVRDGGRVVGVGYAPTVSLSVPTPSFVLDEVVYLGSRYAHRDDLANAVALAASGAVETVVGLVRPLAEVNEAFEALESGSIVGRAVLVVREDASTDAAEVPLS